MSEDTDYVCTLSPELEEKAERELNEKPNLRKSDAQALREMVQNYPGLKVRTDDAFLLKFLRAKKFDYERAFNVLLNHFTMKMVNEKLFSNLRPSAIKHVLEDDISGVLPHRDKFGCRVIVVRCGKWDPSRYNMDDIFRESFINLNYIIKEEETQVNGIRFILDMKDLGWSHARQVTPFYAKMYSSLLQDAFPARFKGLHYLNEPVVFDYIFAIIKPFYNPKTLSRLHFHGQNVKELTEFIDEEYLPEEYGGKQPPYTNKEWVDMLLKRDAEFDEDAKYGLLNLGAPPSTNKEDAMEGTIGGFNKLDI